MPEIRTVDLSTAPVDSASISDRAESISTTSGGGSVSAVATVGHRASVGSASGDDVLVQTPERVVGGGSWTEATFTALLAGTQTGRIFECGFIDDSDIGAYFRITGASTLQLVVEKAAGTEQVTTISASGIDFTRVKTYAVRIHDERRAEFLIDGVSKGSVDATTARLFARLGGLRAGYRLRNPSALVASANVDVHEWKINAEEFPAPKRALSSAKGTLLVFKSSGGRLHELNVATETGDERYVMVFDKSTDPVNTDVPVFRFRIAGGARTFRLEPSDRGLRFAKGVSVALSTSFDSLTLPGAAEAFIEGAYT